MRTPARKLLELPTQAAAQVIAGEFEAQKDEINPATMPATKLANTVIDGIMPDPQPILEDLVRFAASDLLCYRAKAPRELVEMQAQHWDRVIDWYRDAHGANFILAEGVIHVAQPREAMAVFASLANRHHRPVQAWLPAHGRDAYRLGHAGTGVRRGLPERGGSLHRFQCG